MTANDIEKIDPALRKRPSRFKFVRKFDNPSAKLRERLVEEWADQIEGLNLDQILRLSEFKKEGFDLEQALAKLDVTPEEFQLIAR